MPGGSVPRASSGETLVDKLYSQIKDDICMGRLEPGSKLQLGEIRQQHNVSLSVVREAVTRLASERLHDETKIVIQGHGIVARK